MSDIWVAIISGLTTIIVTYITHRYLYRIEQAKIDAQKNEKGEKLKKEPSAGSKTSKQTKSTSKPLSTSVDMKKNKKTEELSKALSAKNTSLEQSRWTVKPFPILVGLIFGIVAYPVAGQIITMISSSAQTTTPMISLSDAKVKFKISVNDQQFIVPAGSNLATLSENSKITIETQVGDAEGVSYPGELTFTYYFASGEKFSGNPAPHIVSQSQRITVQIANRITGEVLIRTLSIELQ